jgi:hypothetical protein
MMRCEVWCLQVRLADGFNQTVCVTGELLPYILTVQASHCHAGSLSFFWCAYKSWIMLFCTVPWCNAPSIFN